MTSHIPARTSACPTAQEPMAGSPHRPVAPVLSGAPISCAPLLLGKAGGPDTRQPTPEEREFVAAMAAAYLAYLRQREQ